jgi:DNA-binding NarL/FixJ family response regulator
MRAGPGLLHLLRMKRPPVSAPSSPDMEWGSRVHGSAVTIRVVIAEDSLIVRTGIQQILGLAPNVEVVASCGDLPELMEAIEREHPDVVLTDIRMPPTQVDEGIKVAGWLRKAHPDIGVVVLSQYADPSYALTLLEPGSDRRGYLLRSACTTRRSSAARSKPSLRAAR